MNHPLAIVIESVEQFLSQLDYSDEDNRNVSIKLVTLKSHLQTSQVYIVYFNKCLWISKLVFYTRFQLYFL